ncbi:MAG: KOW domain-containing RNA-binding protein [Clostridia bacterium]|nr:KOW domain-containing RNA-binding protein [Clostridia bacterium]
MKPIPFEPGRIVLSKQGRDQGRTFVILKVVDDQYVEMANGSTRKADHPKRKKIKHLHPKPQLAQQIAQTLQTGGLPMDSDLRKVLADEGNV